jgi:hypothetical protein
MATSNLVRLRFALFFGRSAMEHKAMNNTETHVPILIHTSMLCIYIISLATLNNKGLFSIHVFMGGTGEKQRSLCLQLSRPTTMSINNEQSLKACLST